MRTVRLRIKRNIRGFEAIHALGVDYHRYPRAHAEVIVDTTISGPVVATAAWVLGSAWVSAVSDGRLHLDACQPGSVGWSLRRGAGVLSGG